MSTKSPWRRRSGQKKSDRGSGRRRLKTWKRPRGHAEKQRLKKLGETRRLKRPEEWWRWRRPNERPRKKRLLSNRLRKTKRLRHRWLSGSSYSCFHSVR